jgi:hypothetical protein
LQIAQIAQSEGDDLRRFTTAATLAAVLAGFVAGGAGAVHWPYFGGDAGRSGNQPVDKGGLPVTFAYAKTADTGIQTSIVTSAGTPSTQRLVYGTSNGRIHQQILETGAPVGAEEGVDIANGDNADVFTGAGGSVTPGDTSGATGLGQIYAVHNDDNQGGTNDIAIAQIDETTGNVIADAPVAGTDGFTVSSSVLLTGPDSGGARSLFFVAASATETRLFKVPILNAAATTASIQAATSIVVASGNPLASPTLVFLNNSAGTPTAYVAVAGATQILTFAVSDLAAGPASNALGGLPQTPSVPVTAAGNLPGSPAPPATAPALFVAVDTGTATVVHKLVQQGAVLGTAATSASLAGDPAPGLAVTQEAPATGSATGGKVVVTTSANLYLLNADTLAAAGTFGTSPQTGFGGFSRTTAAASGELVYVTRDNGQQLVLKLADAQPVTAAEFTQNTGNTGSAAAYGQPSLSRGFVQFASDKGAFVYRNKDLTAPTVALTAPAAGSTATGTVTVTATAFDARGIAKVDFQVDGRTVATDTTGEGNAFATPGATFSATFDSRTITNGSRSITAVATDVGGVTGTSAPVAVTFRNAAATPPRPATPKAGPCANAKNGTARNDLISGTSFGDVIHGLAGNDVISGFSQRDCLHGDAGNDRLFGGNDVDRLFGGVGADLLDGAAGNDFLSGGTGNDRESGGAGNDQLYGGPGNDNLRGGVGVDRLDGNAGNDTIDSYDGRREVVNCGTGVDRVLADRLDVLRQCERVTRRN